MAAFVRGLLAGLPRVNCWSIAGHAGEQCPRGTRRMLAGVMNQPPPEHADGPTEAGLPVRSRRRAAGT